MNKNKSHSTGLDLVKGCIKKKQLLLISVLVVSIFVVFVASFSPIVYRELIDDFIPKGMANQVVLYVVILVSLPVFNLLLTFGKNHLAYKFSNAVSEELRRRAYSACLHMEYSEFEKIGYQKAKQTITREVGQICDVFLFGECVSAFSSGLQIIVAFFMLLYLNWLLAVAALCILPGIVFLINRNKDHVSVSERKLMELLGRCDNYLTHSLTGIKTIKAANAQDYEMEEFDSWLDENKVVGWKIKSAHTFSRTILPNVAQQMAYGLLIVVCAFLVMRQRLTMGTLIAGMSYIPLLFTSANDLLGTKIGFASINSAIESLDKLLDSEQERGTTQAFAPKETAIQIKDLDFAYSRNDFHVHIDDLRVQKGEFLAVVGGSGSGKSALFDVLCRYYKVDTDAIRIFGKPVNELDPKALRNVIRFVPQDTFLWNKSIEENIIYPGRPEKINRDRYDACVKAAGLVPFFETLNEGDQTVLGDFGSQISGGEKQRISLARALYSDFEILCLDEPTAALDSIKAEEIFDTITSLKEKAKMLIVVTHDIAKAMRADTIIVMSQGEIVERGKPEELLATGTRFRKLYEAFQVKD